MRKGRGSQYFADGFTPRKVAARAWLLHSAGPDRAYHNLGGVIANETSTDGPILLIYDATNGTVSFGSIYRVGGQAGTISSAKYAAGKGISRAAQTAMR